MIRFSVFGNPLPKQSYRHSKTGGYTDPRIKAWQERVAIAARIAMQGQPPSTDEFTVRLRFFRSDRRRVDLDNLSKAVLDACNGIVWEDDKQVVSLHLSKHYNKENPGVIVQIDEFLYAEPCRTAHAPAASSADDG